MGTGSKRDYKECSPSRVAKYKGLRRPACNGGSGCHSCWAKFESTGAKQARKEKLADRIFGRP